MAKTRLNHTLLFVLITAFLTTQWTIAHIHLTEDHDHGGSRHQHSSEAHAHHSIASHADAIDFSHQPNDLNIVELDHELSTQKAGKLDKPATANITSVFPLLSLVLSDNARLPGIVSTKLSYLFRSTVRSRAPPQYS